MNANTQPDQPHFVIDETEVDATVVRRLKQLERTINDRPQEAIETLGSLATLNSISSRELDEREATLKRSPKDLIEEYFSQRYDLDMEFDPGTEESITQNEEYLNLRAQHLSARNVDVKLGIQKKGSAVNPNAEPLRDQMRRKRLELYIGRVLEFQEISPKQNGDDHLRSVG